MHFAGLTLVASLTFAFFWYRNARDRFTEFQAFGEHGFFVAIGTASAIRVFLCGVYFFLFMRTSKRGGKGGDYELTAHDEL